METKFKSFDPSEKRYFQRNYGDAIRNIVPTVYELKDFQVSGLELDPLDLILECQINAAQNISTLIDVSATLNYPQITDISGIFPFFVKQNNLTNVTPFSFERDILDPLGTEMESFDTSTQWYNYLRDHILPLLKLQNEKYSFDPTTTVFTPENSNKAASSAYGITEASGFHEYFLGSLGWAYILNTSAPANGIYDPSSYILDKFVDLYYGKEFNTLEGVLGLQEYTWKNNGSLPSFQRAKLIPDQFVSGVSSSVYTSGVQNLDRLKTLLGVLYASGVADDTDFFVRDAFETYMTLSSVNIKEINAGPFNKLQRALGYFYQDINSPVEDLENLLDIEKCPDEYLPQIAHYIGWEFVGSDPSRWRVQLRNAVRIYKAKGTAWATQLALDTIFGSNSGMSLSGTLHELYESYLPDIIYYLLSTECPFFNKDAYKENPFTFWTEGLALSAGVTYPYINSYGFYHWENIIVDYSHEDAESNIKKCVDKIIRSLYKKHPDHFWLGDEPWPKPFVHGQGQLDSGDAPNPFVFKYRGPWQGPMQRSYEVPPFEDRRYYEKVSISTRLLNSLKEELRVFNVPDSIIQIANDYIGTHTTSATDDISIGNTWNFFTSGYQEPFNLSSVLDDISNRRAKLLPIWSAKASHFDLHLSSDNYVFSKKKETKDTTLGIQQAVRALYKTIPAHAIPRVKILLEAIEKLDQVIYACPKPMYTPWDLFTGSTAANGWDNSGVNMGLIGLSLGLGAGLSGAGNTRDYVNSITKNLMNGDQGTNTSVNTVPRNSLRRRDFHTTLPRTGYYDRTGQNMPVGYAPSAWTPVDTDGPGDLSGGGALTLGYNYSGCEFQTPFLNNQTSTLHDVWSDCETSTSRNQFFGIDTSNTFNWRGQGTMIDRVHAGTCLDLVRRFECPEIIRVMHSAMEADALRNAQAYFKNVSGAWLGESASAMYMNPIVCLANSGFNGVSSWEQYSDFTFGEGVNKVYNNYSRYFGRHGTAPHLVDGPNAHGGKSIFAHIYGPTLFNGNFTLDGSAAGTIASALNQDFSGVTHDTLVAAGADGSALEGQGNLVIGKTAGGTKGEFRYPFGFSGVEYCYRTQVSNASKYPVFKNYTLAHNYKVNNPSLAQSYLDRGGILEVSGLTDNTLVVPRIRFDLSSVYGTADTSANFLLPEHEFEFNLKLARVDGLEDMKIWVWIHTMPEDGLFWSWVNNSNLNYSNSYLNGYWKQGYVSGIEQSLGPAYHAVKYNFSNQFSTPKAIATQLEYINEGDFKEYKIRFNTNNRENRPNSNFLKYPPQYTKEFLHRVDQHYVVEVLFEAINSTHSPRYIIPEVSIIDQTLARTALDVIDIGYEKGNGVKEEYTITRSDKDDYRIMFKFMNSLAASSLGQGFATRIAADSSGIFAASGGSRLNNRYHPKWGGYGEYTVNSEGAYTAINFKEGK